MRAELAAGRARGEGRAASRSIPGPAGGTHDIAHYYRRASGSLARMALISHGWCSFVRSDDVITDSSVIRIVRALTPARPPACKTRAIT